MGESSPKKLVNGPWVEIILSDKYCLVCTSAGKGKPAWSITLADSLRLLTSQLHSKSLFRRLCRCVYERVCLLNLQETVGGLSFFFCAYTPVLLSLCLSVISSRSLGAVRPSPYRLLCASCCCRSMCGSMQVCERRAARETVCPLGIPSGHTLSWTLKGSGHRRKGSILPLRDSHQNNPLLLKSSAWIHRELLSSFWISSQFLSLLLQNICRCVRMAVSVLTCY